MVHCEKMPTVFEFNLPLQQGHSGSALRTCMPEASDALRLRGRQRPAMQSAFGACVPALHRREAMVIHRLNTSGVRSPTSPQA